MSSLREQILVRLAALLPGQTPAGTSVYRSREEPINRDMSPAIIIRPFTETTQTMSECADRSDFDIDFIIITRGDPWETSAEAIAVDVHRLIMADSVLESLCQHARRLTADWQGKEGDLTAGALTLKYRFVYLSDTLNITRFPVS